VPLSDRGLPQRDGYTQFKIPEDAQKRINLVAGLMQSFDAEAAVLVWFDDWNVWPSGQRMHIVDRFRKSYGETQSLFESPARLFSNDEREDVVSFVTLAVLMLWDCYVITPKQEKFLFFSHDEYGLQNNRSDDLGS
jgi:hypothetical protein